MSDILFLLQDKTQKPGVAEQLLAFVPILLCIVLFWFMIIRPQKKEQKRKQEMLNTLSKNDHVWISPGIFGIVEKIKDEQVTVKIDEENKTTMKVMKSAILVVDKKSSSDKSN